MKLTFLDSLPKRIAFSFGITCLILMVSYLIYGGQAINLMGISIIAILVYIPITLFYAVVSTFFPKDDKAEDADILDDGLV